MAEGSFPQRYVRTASLMSPAATEYLRLYPPRVPAFPPPESLAPYARSDIPPPQASQRKLISFKPPARRPVVPLAIVPPPGEEEKEEIVYGEGEEEEEPRQRRRRRRSTKQKPTVAAQSPEPALPEEIAERMTTLSRLEQKQLRPRPSPHVTTAEERNKKCRLE